MTDFVAVIRRAVDGLKDNNPEMRAKVYEKARSAVLKQLENMKPQPTADVIARQMAKLDAAVISVENEHADAIPEDLAPVEEQIYAPEPAPDDSWEGEQHPDSYEEPVEQPVTYAAPAAPPYQAPVQPAFEPAPYQPPAPLSNPMPAAAADNDMLWMPDDDEEDQAVAAAPPAPPQTVTPPKPASPSVSATPSPFPIPPASTDIPWDESPFEEDLVPAPPAKQTPRPAAAPVINRDAPLAVDKGSFSDISDLAGFDAPMSGSGKAGSKAKRSETADVERIVSKLEGRSFRAQPKPPKITLAGIAAGLAGLIIVGVGGYGAWAYRDTIMSIVTGSSSSALDTATLDKPKPVEMSAPATPASTPAKPVQTAAATPKDTTNSGKFTQRLLPDGSETNESLTGLPKTDAKEGKSVAEQTVKSKDVAAATPATPAQTATDGTAAPATDVTAAPAPDTATTAQTDTNTAADPNAVAGVTQKMFLYEERLGQASPTAIAGSVVWTVANDTSTTGKPQPEIQAKVSVPDRGLSAIISFKRNADKSLPASHVVELVFSLPKDFDGGAIDSVQRIAFKQTEQDRGNSLIGVPAKITDDFHMIALNDDPDALASNTDLLKNRNWIDIPITYRNGRRALITIEKGTTGADDFNKVMAEWAALGPA